MQPPANRIAPDEHVPAELELPLAIRQTSADAIEGGRRGKATTHFALVLLMPRRMALRSRARLAASSLAAAWISRSGGSCCVEPTSVGVFASYVGMLAVFASHVGLLVRSGFSSLVVACEGSAGQDAPEGWMGAGMRAATGSCVCAENGT